MAKAKKTSKKPKTTASSSKEAKDVEKKTTAKKTEKAEKVATEKATEKKVIASEKKPGLFKKFFAKKYEGNESILTIFKDKKVYGALLGEVFGTMFIALVILTLGMYQPLYLFFVLIAVIIAVYKLSGANLNPINTVGMMATRRMSVIRGVLYLLAQVIGAWIGVLIISAFMAASGPDTKIEGMAAIDAERYWIVTFIEFFGAAIVGFFYARAQQFRKNSVAFAAIVAGGTMIAVVSVYLISYNYFGLSNNFMMNPAIALMYQILPTSADTVGELLLEIGKALFTYVLFPMVGGVLGFFLSDAASQLADE